MKTSAFTNVCGLHPIPGGLNGARQQLLSLFLFLPMNIAASGSWDLRCQDLHEWSPGVQGFSLKLHHQLPQFSALSLGLSNKPDFACSLAYREQTVGLHLLMVWTHSPNIQKNLDHYAFELLRSTYSWVFYYNKCNTTSSAVSWIWGWGTEGRESCLWGIRCI